MLYIYICLGVVALVTIGVGLYKWHLAVMQSERRDIHARLIRAQSTLASFLGTDRKLYPIPSSVVTDYVVNNNQSSFDVEISLLAKNLCRDYEAAQLALEQASAQLPIEGTDLPAAVARLMFHHDPVDSEDFNCKVRLIRAHRILTKVGLKESKEWVERWFGRCELKDVRRVLENSNSQEEETV